MLIEWGKDGRRCTECGFILTDNDCLDHTCKMVAAKADKPKLGQVLKDYELTGKHEVAAAQKKGGWNV